MTRLVILLIAVTLAVPAHARMFRPGFGSPVVVVLPSHHHRPIGSYYYRRNGVWSSYRYLTPQALAHWARCRNELLRVYGHAELRRDCWE